MVKLNQAELRRVIHYDPKTGVLKWKVATGRRVRVGDIAGSILCDRDNRQRRRMNIHGYAYYAHRLAFLYMKGHWPRGQVDHKNRDTLDNRWSNLRECTGFQNQANRGPNKNNKLAIKGVSYNKTMKKFQATLWANGKRAHRSYHDTLEDATRAYKRAAKKFHGNFAKWS